MKQCNPAIRAQLTLSYMEAAIPDELLVALHHVDVIAGAPQERSNEFYKNIEYFWFVTLIFQLYLLNFLQTIPSFTKN